MVGEEVLFLLQKNDFSKVGESVGQVPLLALLLPSTGCEI
jgi:hypothetical protein